MRDDERASFYILAGVCTIVAVALLAIGIWRLN